MTSGIMNKKWWGWGAACALFAGMASGADLAPPVEVTDKARIQKTEANGFTHPGIGLNQEILENARAQVLAKRDPWYSGFVKLASNPRSSKNVSIANRSEKDPTLPAVDAFDSGSVQGRLKSDSDTALRQE